MSGLAAPFPWFGGKSRAASLIWERFGDVPNYVEPFAGSLAVLLQRPHEPHTETVNDLDAYLVNFWRAVREAPQEVARWADWPVTEADLLARHDWLLAQEGFRERMRAEPDLYDAKVAGWWVWGISAWIGSGWCRVPAQQLPHLGRRQGINRRNLPHLGDAGRDRRSGDQPQRAPAVTPWIQALSERLRHVRIACGDWTRVLGDSVTWRHGTTAVLLDPPYTSDEHSVRYFAQGGDVAVDVRAWAIEHGNDPRLRIALCGYAGPHVMPDCWTMERWKALGGYGSQGDGRGRENASRETIWFSPHCHAPHQGVLPLEAS